MSKDSNQEQLVYRSDDDVEFIQEVKTNLLPESKQTDKYLKSNHKTTRIWSEYQLKQLRRYYNKYPNQWDLIAKKMGTRSKECILNKYRSLKQRKQWNRLINYGQINPRGQLWSPEQDQQLLKFLKIFDNDWKMVQSKLGRSELSCKNRYRTLKDKQRKQRWKAQQLKLLRQLGSSFSSDWKIAENLFPNRTAWECRQKYERILELQQAAKLKQQKRKENQKNQIVEPVDQQQQYLRNKMITAIQTNLQDLQQTKSKRKTARKWIEQEDRLLLYLYKKGCNWLHISSSMINRSVYQCQHRFNAIQQEKSIFTHVGKIEKQIWTKEQQDLLLKLYQQHPKQWKQISRYFTNKTQSQVMKKFHELENSMKNRYGLLIWTKEDKELLQNIIQKYPGDMNVVYQRFPNHNPQDIRKKYLILLKEKVKRDKQLQQQKEKQNINEIPAIDSAPNSDEQYQSIKSISISIPNESQSQQKKIIWTKKQDIQLLKSFKMYQQDWNQIALLFPNRKLQDIVNHHKQLQSKLENFKRKWTNDEDQKLRTLYNKFGSQWELIKQSMPMRTLVQLKKRLNQLQIMNINEYTQGKINKDNNKSKQKKNEQELNFYESPIKKKMKLSSISVPEKIKPVQQKIESSEFLQEKEDKAMKLSDITKSKLSFKRIYQLDTKCNQCQSLKKQIQQIKLMLTNLVRI